MQKLPFASLGILLVIAFSTLSCSGSSSSDAPRDGGTTLLTGDGGFDATTGLTGSTPVPCDIAAVLEANCQSCHSNPPTNSAPMPLVTWEDFQRPAVTQPSEKVYQLVETRINSATAPMPPKPNPALDTADLATMNDWLNAGAAAGAGVCSADASVPIPDAAPPVVSCTTDNVSLAPATPWSMPTDDDDDYVCYSVNLPASASGATSHVLAITPNIVNHKIVHHVLLFEADPSDTSITTTPQKCSAGGSLQWRIVYGWAPGGGAMQTPPNVGFPYDGTTKWVVQVHYNNVNHLANETDTSGFSFCSTDQPVQYDSDVIAFGTQNISVPAHGALDQTCSITVPSLFAGIHLFSAFPHMHQIGTAIETEQVMPNGGIVDLGRNDPWSFNNQVWFPIEATLTAGDVVNTRCAWQNSTDQDVTFGQNTENEMCYSFTAYYPRVTSSLWSWALPSLQASCAPTPATGLPVPDGGWVISDSGSGSTPVPVDAGAGASDAGASD